jgi:hypothetical protein
LDGGLLGYRTGEPMTVLRASQPVSKDERYREIVSVFARNGIGILEERFSKHDVDEAIAA